MSENAGFEPPDGEEPPLEPPPAQAGFFDDPRRRVAAIVAAALAVGLLGGVGLAVLAGGDDDGNSGDDALVEDTVTPSVTSAAPEATETPSTSTSASPSATASTTPSASASASASASPTPTGTAGPTVAPSTSTTPSTGAVTMTYALSTKSAQVGDVVTATVVVRNDRDTAIRLVGGTCKARVTQATAQLGKGPTASTVLTGTLRAFRDKALAATPDPVPFDPISTCGTTVAPFVVPAHSVATDKHPWPASSVNGSPYNNTVAVSVRATYRTTEAPTTDVELTAPTQSFGLTGGSAARLTAGQAVERALGNADFATAVNASNPSIWPDGSGTGFVQYFGKTGTVDGTREEWVVYLVTARDEGTEGGVRVTVDRTTGAVGPVTPFSRTPATG